MPYAVHFRFCILFFHYCYYTAFFCFCRYPVSQACRKLRQVDFFKYSSKCITVRYSVWKFQKFCQILLTAFAKCLNIGKSFPSTYYGTQNYDYDTFELMTDIFISCPSWLFDIFDSFF